MVKAMSSPSADAELDEGAERRQSERFSVVVRVDYSTVDAFFSEFTANVNEGGIFIETDERHPPDTSVSLQFQLPGCDEPLQVSGRVVWNTHGGRGQQRGIGIEFEDLDQMARQRIDDLVRSLRVEIG
jgi:uncharacterized protein (TIGR02266 family)